MIATSLLFAALAPSMALAEEGGGLSDAETSYTGAIILQGEIDASIGAHGLSDLTHDKYEVNPYSYWSGNTLYIGAEDEAGNGIDGIVEFFWFESSVDRGADFYVAVIKARTTPNVVEDWFLLTGDDPVLSVSAKTDISRGNSAFRWDWSLPFENYGMESYGKVTMRSSYGIGLSSGGTAEGTAMAAKKVDENGAQAEVEIQAKGHVSGEYNVNTEYTVNLWTWYTRVRGEPGEMTWTMNLDNATQDDESAYHEYFLVMQAEEGQPFIIDELQITGGVDEEWAWFGSWHEFGVKLENVELTPPAYEPEPEDTGDDTGYEDTGVFGDTGEDTATEDSGLTFPDVNGAPLDDNEPKGCSSTGPGSFLGAGLLALGMLLVGRRRR